YVRRGCLQTGFGPLPGERGPMRAYTLGLFFEASNRLPLNAHSSVLFYPGPSAVHDCTAPAAKFCFVSSNVTKCHQMSSLIGIHPKKFVFRCGNGRKWTSFC